ncbi:MAG TPA: tRNA pseudouridine(55) synthase TruB [Candidatus Saccharimonadia bacterium]|nr:tRNA pseudouridine(55) synthase TruB [Candidatus Saccharimonadia bacterium]
MEASTPEINGLLLIDKPVGLSSFDVIRRLRRQTGVRKIGHAGTLDPLATGMMLMLFGAACKRAEVLTKLDKRYVAQITLGATSSTGDGEGEKTLVSAAVPDRAAVATAIAQLTGMITQTPPVYSAIKIGGKEAYKRARAGETVVMPSRQVTVYENVLTRYDYPVVELEAKVSSGTYIRTLAEDLGALLETGAYLSGLVRTEVGEYRLTEAQDLALVEAKNVRLYLKNV